MRHPLLLAISAFVVWSGAFLTIYAVQATGCSLEEASSLREALVGLRERLEGAE